MSVKQSMARVAPSSAPAASMRRRASSAAAGRGGMPPEKVADEAETLMRQHLMFFQEADLNGDGELDFMEFCSALPPVLRRQPREKLKQFFRLADKDDDGTITMDEFINWSLTMAKAVTGGDVLRVLRSKDANGKATASGVNKAQFMRRAQSLGFSDHANEIFEALPLNGDGQVDCDAIAAATRMPNLDTAQTMREFLIGMAWNTTSDAVDAFDTTGWSFTGSGPESARVNLFALACCVLVCLVLG